MSETGRHRSLLRFRYKQALQYTQVAKQVLPSHRYVSETGRHRSLLRFRYKQALQYTQVAKQVLASHRYV
jgi:hypothetical protein